METRIFKRSAKIVAAVALGAALGTGLASADQQRPAELHFADLGNIRTWQPDGANAMYIQNNRREWYRATFFSPCTNLPFAFAVAFVTEPNGSLNKYSSILVEGERCWFQTFSTAQEPDNSDGRHDIESSPS
jgi:Family of unknown function (DUF6491)